MGFSCIDCLPESKLDATPGNPPTLGLSVEFVRFQWVDYSGILRTRILTREHCLDLVQQAKPLRCNQQSLLCLADGTVLPHEPSGVHLLYPDWSSLKPGDPSCPYATVMCSIVEIASPESPPQRGLCPRQSLKTVSQAAHVDYGLEILVGFEIEFVVLRHEEGKGLSPASSHIGAFAAAGLRDPGAILVEEAIRGIQAMGVPVQGFHVEGPGAQYEISLGPRPPLQAVDNLVTAQDIVKSTFRKHGLTATMAPKPILDGPGNGLHVHVSMQPVKKAREDAFLAGILHRLAAICALGLPYEPSYVRLKPFEAGEVVSWGTESRRAPVRKISAGHWEVRCADATANPYLLVSAIVASGLLGIQKGESLSWPDVSLAATRGVREVVGTPLPRNLTKSLMALGRDCADFASVLGGDAIDRYLSLKLQESTVFQSLDDEAFRGMLTNIF